MKQVAAKLSHLKLPDTEQNFWQLAAIQLTGVTSLPVLATSILILNKYNLTSALYSLIVGNILLWAIGLAIAACDQKHRENILALIFKQFSKSTL